jgi:hypothetical protein
MWWRVAVVRIDVSEESVTSIISVTRIFELWPMLTESSNWRTMRRKNKILAMFLAPWFLSDWWWRPYFLPKCRFLQKPHDITFKKTVFFVVTTVKTWNLKYLETRFIHIKLNIVELLQVSKHMLYKCLRDHYERQKKSSSKKWRALFAVNSRFIDGRSSETNFPIVVMTKSNIAF